jgi:homoserine kinase type II
MKLKDSQIKDVLKDYSIGILKSKKLIYNEWNTAYHLKTTKGDFLLKVLNFQNEKELLKEIKIINLLKDKIPCSFPLSSKSGKLYINYCGSIILIKKFIRGRPILRGEKLSNNNLLSLGKYYATIHKQSNLSNIPKKDLYKTLQNFFNKLDKKSPEYKVAESTFYLLKCNEFRPNNMPKGLIHADLHTENLLVNNSKIVAILDFEDSHIGSFVYDLGICILDTCWKRDGFSQNRINTLIRGYESIRKLTEEEKKHLIDSAILAGLYTMHFSIIKNGINKKKNLDYYVVRRFLKLLKLKHTTKNVI